MGHWQLVRVLGEGAMTRVYLARPAEHEDAQPTYAVKSLKRELVTWRKTVGATMPTPKETKQQSK